MPRLFPASIWCSKRALAVALRTPLWSLAVMTELALAEVSVLFMDTAGTVVPDVVIWPITITTPAQEKKPHEQATDKPASLRKDIDQRDKRFDPFVSNIKPGTKVFFPNSDDTRHHVYSFSEGNAFERKLYRANEAEPVRFDNEGIVALGCNIHDNMQAYIVVSNDAIVQSDAEGYAGLPEGTRALRIWHPALGDEPLETSLLSMTKTATGYSWQLPFIWSDPQAPKSSAQLESLLKRFSRDPH